MPARPPSSSPTFRPRKLKVDVILVVAFDLDAIYLLQTAMILREDDFYDVLVEHPDVFYVTFDNVGVGRRWPRPCRKGKAEGDFAHHG
jgi:hypothetical protein